MVGDAAALVDEVRDGVLGEDAGDGILVEVELRNDQADVAVAKVVLANGAANPLGSDANFGFGVAAFPEFDGRCGRRGAGGGARTIGIGPEGAFDLLESGRAHALLRAEKEWWFERHVGAAARIDDAPMQPLGAGENAHLRRGGLLGDRRRIGIGQQGEGDLLGVAAEGNEQAEFERREDGGAIDPDAGLAEQCRIPRAVRNHLHHAFGVPGIALGGLGVPGVEQAGQVAQFPRQDGVVGDAGISGKSAQRIARLAVLAEFSQGGVELLDEAGTLGDGGEKFECSALIAHDFFEQHEAGERVERVVGGQAEFLGQRHGKARETEHLGAECSAAGRFRFIGASRTSEQYAFSAEGGLLRHDPEQGRTEGRVRHRGADFLRTEESLARPRPTDHQAHAHIPAPQLRNRRSVSLSGAMASWKRSAKLDVELLKLRCVINERIGAANLKNVPW